MPKKFKIDPTAYGQLMKSVNQSFLTDSCGDKHDFTVFKDDLWLSDSAVIERLTRLRGAWAVNLVFADTANPLRFLVRHIVTNPSRERAVQQAYYMRRLAAKDQRGTLKVSAAQFNISDN